MVSSGRSISHSSVGGNDEIPRPPSSRRSLDFGLNRSLRCLDTRYVQESDQESESGANNESGCDFYHQGNNRRGTIDDSSRSGYLSRTNDPLDDISYWSGAASSRWQEEHGSFAAAAVSCNYDEEDESEATGYGYNNSSDDPRSVFFHLLDRHCSIYPNGSEDKVTAVYDYESGDYEYSNRGKINDWEPIREWLQAMMTPFGKPRNIGNEEESEDNPTHELIDDLEEHDPHKEARDKILRAAVLEARGRSGETVLHIACERSVPFDVLQLLLSVEVPPRKEDSFYSAKSLATCATIDGWLPLHYACNYPNEYAVVERLVEIFPDAKTHADLKGRTPLHFAMREENMNRPQVVALLACAAGIADDNGILPLHYACLYGATEDFLRILTEAYPAGIASKDRFGRVPLHYSLSNAGKPNAPEAVRLLLASEPSLVNIPGIARVFSGSDAVRKYAGTAKEHDLYKGYYSNYYKGRASSKSQRFSFEGKGSNAANVTKEVFSREAVEECLKRFLEAKPNPTADFFTALQSLPQPLREKAVLMRVVQELLNKKIGQRFPTVLLLLDLYLQVIVMVSYTLAVRNSITWRFMDDDLVGIQLENKAQQFLCLFGLYLALTYFLFREIVQIIGLVSLKASWIWVYEPGNWLNVTYIAVIGTWTVFATTGKGDNDVFRNGAALSFAILWLKFLSYLRKILIDFSVFSGGVFHVMKRLFAFLMCLTIILIAFSRMFFALFYETDYCKEASPQSGDFGEYSFLSVMSVPPLDDEEFIKNLICEANDTKIPWCNPWDSFLAVYTMLLGEVDETVFGDNSTALVLFVVFMLLVVILLANVLIAIVTDSYKVIRDKRAAIVFWTNRLDFIAQMDAIANGPWKARLRSLMHLPCTNDDATTSAAVDKDDDNRSYFFEDTFGQDIWNDICELFEHESLVEDGIFSLDFVLCTLLRLVALLLVPLWILVGALSVGLLWPPQIRERLFVGSITNSYGSKSEQEETLRKTQIENLKSEIAQLKHDLVQESSQHKTQIVQMKSAVAERKLETLNTLTAIKKNVVLALELCEIGREG